MLSRLVCSAVVMKVKVEVCFLEQRSSQGMVEEALYFKTHLQCLLVDLTVSNNYSNFV